MAFHYHLKFRVKFNTHREAQEHVEHGPTFFRMGVYQPEYYPAVAEVAYTLGLTAKNLNTRQLKKLIKKLHLWAAENEYVFRLGELSPV